MMAYHRTLLLYLVMMVFYAHRLATCVSVMMVYFMTQLLYLMVFYAHRLLRLSFENACQVPEFDFKAGLADDGDL